MQTLAALGGAAATWTTSAQAAALVETSGWLRGLLGAAGADDVVPVLPAGLIGSTASGRPMAALTGTVPAVYFARLGAGWQREQAATSALGWLNRIAGTEPYRAANLATGAVAEGDERFTGRVVRITRPDACDFCKLIADRGYVPARAGFAAHANCRCTPSPEISGHATSRRSIGRGRDAAEGRQPTPAAPVGRTPGEGRADAVPINFEKIPKSRRDAYEADVRATLRRSLRGIRSDITDRLTEIRVADPTNNPADRRVGRRALAWFRPSDNTITVRPGTSQPKLDILAAQLRVTDRSPISWWPSTIDPSLPQSNTISKVVIAHETGHFLDFQLNPGQKAELGGIIRETAEANMALQPETDQFPSAARQVSQYAGTNREELIAESWAEYVLAPEPRPMATAIGDAIVRYLGTSPPGFYTR